MTTANKRDEAIVLGALPGVWEKFPEALAVAKVQAGEKTNWVYRDARKAMNGLKRAGKIRYNRSAKVWEKCE